MRYCKKCLEPDTRPDSVFDEEGICFPCRYAEQAHRIDWEARRRELDKLVAWGRARNVTGYDCVIPVSGGKDSHRQAIFARDDLGLNPLLVSCVYPPEQQTVRGAHNLANLISLGFDCFYVSPAPETWKQLMKVGFKKFGNMFKSTELALYATGPKVATLYHIPLVFYGENPALSWGSAGGSLDGNANRMKYSNTLKGGDLSSYLEEGYEPKDIYWYRYPSDEDIDLAQLRIVYLGYYIPDFNDFENAKISIANGLECRTGEDAVLEDIGQLTTFDALDDDFVMVNQMLKYIKFGFGKASEQCSGVIRTGEMTRDEAIELAEKLDGKCADRYIRRFCDFIGISEDEFWEIAERYRGKDVWERDGNAWKLKVPLR